MARSEPVAPVKMMVLLPAANMLILVKLSNSSVVVSSMDLGCIRRDAALYAITLTGLRSDFMTAKVETTFLLNTYICNVVFY